jgi:hypothetical protein
MTRLQKIFFGIGVFAILGLGVLIYKQFSTSTTITPTTNTMKQESRTDVSRKQAAPVVEKPVTPDDVALDILSEVDEDNLALSEEELGETSEIESEGDVVGDFATIYDENEN